MIAQLFPNSAVRVAAGVAVVLMSFMSTNVKAHSPDVSSLMIYQQHNKLLLVIKSSLTALEGEIDFYFHKGAYNTPEEFTALVLRYFQNNCTIIINGDTIKFLHPQVQLGHETTIFAELVSVPTDLKTLFVKNALFKDVSNHQCELILAAKDLPQKQAILYNGNDNEVTLHVDNKHWVIDSPRNFFNAKLSIAILVLLCLMALTAVLLSRYKKSKLIPTNVPFTKLTSP